MEAPFREEMASLISVGVVLLVAVSLTTCVLTAVQLLRGKVIPYEPRRRVPWRVIDLLTVLFVNAALALLVELGTVELFDLERPPPPGTHAADELEVAHPLVVLLHEASSIWTLLLCGFVGVVVAPITEEFMFRLLLQGWLEAVENRSRRWIPVLRRLLPGATPIAVTSLFFAAMHYRASPPAQDARWLAAMFICGAIVGLLTMAFAVWLLWFRTGAAAVDFGFLPERVFADVRLGLLVFLALAAPLYLLQFDLRLQLPTHPIVDPITLFVFAMALGTLYYRTHRIVPCIVAHMALNMTSLALAWLQL